MGRYNSDIRFIPLKDQDNIKFITNAVVSDPFPYNFTDSFTNEQGHETQNLAARIIVYKDGGGGGGDDPSPSGGGNECLSFTAHGVGFKLNFAHISLKGGAHYDDITDMTLEDKIFQYSFDKNEWVNFDDTVSSVTIEENSTLYLKGDNPDGINWNIDSIGFRFRRTDNSKNGTIECHGNIMSLLGEDVETIPNEYCFYALFAGCSYLTTAPTLPATALTNYCYSQMFAYCTSLTTAPELPATTLATSCYSHLFDNCTSLVNAPELPATTLATSCYSEMFGGCSSLTTAPVLSATTLTNWCYYQMFTMCFSLSSVTCLAENGINDHNSTSGWLDSVAMEGVFIKSANATWPQGMNGIPESWEVQDAS